jgi:hypothetical protein
MSEDPRMDLVIDLLKEVREEQKNQSLLLSSHDISLVQITSDLNRNTNDVAEHIKRTCLLEERVDKLEEPIKTRKYLWNRYTVILGASLTLLTFIWLVVKYWQLIVKFMQVTPGIN